MVTTGRSPVHAVQNLSAGSVRSRLALVVGAIAIAGLAAVVRNMDWHRPVESAEPMGIGPAIGMPGAPPSSAEGLRERIAEMEARLR